MYIVNTIINVVIQKMIMIQKIEKNIIFRHQILYIKKWIT